MNTHGALHRYCSVPPGCPLTNKWGTPRLVLCSSLVILCALLSSGCAIGLNAVSAPMVDTQGSFGGEARAGVSFGWGSDPVRFLVAVDGGGGGLFYQGEDNRVGYGVVCPSLGIDTAKNLALRIQTGYCTRFFSHRTHAWSTSASYIFSIVRRGNVMDSPGIGPFFQFELASGFGDDLERAVFFLGITFRWAVFDLTGFSLKPPSWNSGSLQGDPDRRAGRMNVFSR